MPEAEDSAGCAGSAGSSYNLDDLVVDALRHLETLRYSELTVRNYGTTWRSYVRFAATHGVTERFSQEIADEFLADRGVPLAGPARASNARHLRAATRILHEFEYSRCFHRRRNFAIVRCSQSSLNEALEAYVHHCSKYQNLSSQTMHNRRRTIARFLQILEARGHLAPATMTPTDIQIYARS